MKKFLAELEKHPDVYNQMPGDEIINELNIKMIAKYTPLLGKDVFYKSKATKEQYVGKISGIYSDFLTVDCKYYGIGYNGTLTTTVHYRSLFSGEDELEVDE